MVSLVGGTESDEQGSESDSPKKVGKIKTDSTKVYNFIRKILPNENFILAYVDEDDTYAFLHGEMSLEHLLAMKSFIEIENFTACVSYFMGDEE